MDVRLAAAVVVVLVAGCSGPAPASPGTEAGAAGGPSSLAITGVVVDDAIRPLAGVNVTVGDGVAATTAANGTFAFHGLEAGVHVVRAAKRGYADAVTQVVLAETKAAAPVRLVLVADSSTVAYADAYAIDGFVECGIYFVVGYFAACSGPNTVSTIACPATGVCLGNVTGDRSLILLPMQRAPDWVQMEAAWEATVATAEYMMVQSGSTNRSAVAEGGVKIINETVGTSPNLNIIAGKDLDESGIGVDTDSLLYMRLHTAPNPPAGAGFAVEQPFKLIIHVFYGYRPPPGWRFTDDPMVPPPPA